MAKDDNKKKTGLLAAIIIVICIVLVMLFFVQKDNIVSNLKKTNFFERVGVSTPEFVKNHEINEEPAEEEIEIDVLSGKTTVKKNENTSSKKQQEKTEKSEEKNAAESTLNTETKAAAEEKKEETATAEETKTPAVDTSKKVTAETTKKTTPVTEKKVVTTRNANLCFVTIDSNGSVNRKIITRSMPKSDSPLTDSIKALLAGPLPDEASKNAMTLIPEGTKLIGASVKNGVATLNFNENFEFNSYGVEGCIAQLMQIVYTATEFSTVNSVQFLIEGEKKEYLGTEGQWIGSPLSRGNF